MKSIFFYLLTIQMWHVTYQFWQRLAIEGVLRCKRTMLEMLMDNAIVHLSHPGDQNTNGEFNKAVFNISDIISMISISKTCYAIFLHLMAIHDEGRFTMIQTKNTKLSKKKMRTKMAKTRITRFLQINISLHCKVKFNHSIKRK